MVAGCVCVVLIGTFVVALVHKVRVLRSGRAVTQPVLQGPAFARRHATTLVASAAVCEAAVVAALVVRPFAGLLAAAALLGIYTVSVARLPAGAGCGCFGEPSVGDKRVAVLRNGALIAATALAAVAAGTELAVDDVVEPRAFGLALLVAAAPLAVAVMRRHVVSNPRVARKAAP